MDYDGISAATKSLGYRDKLRLAQLLIQLARREEEHEHAEGREPAQGKSARTSSEENLQLIAERILKLRPRTRIALLNSLDAMYQFRGGISAEDKERVIAKLSRGHDISINRNGRVSYCD